ncbi:hypothetical protein [Nocardia vulneris]|uniref:hypothetical protein n=1 Tax=Nocardia vulneris TaxID=1141657 RepID=UPI0005B8C20D|nr:hypothetical protein [Nocardia vulneris]
MNAATIASRQRWDLQHRFCGDESAPASLDEARYVMTTHAAHGPACLQYLAAEAYSGGCRGLA